MPDSSSILDQAINGSIETLQSLKKLEPEVARAADFITDCLTKRSKLLVCGNGGSASDAAHFATELVVRFAKDRPAYPAICLTGDGGLLTAAGNDYGFDEIFARQVAAFGVPGDLLICLTRKRISFFFTLSARRWSRVSRKSNPWRKAMRRAAGTAATTDSLRFFQETVAFAIQLPPLICC